MNKTRPRTKTRPDDAASDAVLTRMFADDGSFPNNSRRALVILRAAIDLKGSPDPELLVESTFARNGWGEMWRNGIDPCPHYHSRAHEALGIARGRAMVRFGGPCGEEIEVEAGDVVIVPAGTGHQGLRVTADLKVIGAYPPNGRYDLCRGSKAEYARALLAIAQVPLPHSDPVFGADGPLLELWR
ncbi:MAG: cupin domain-containing protein [Proteobacteria bacterium]|nr:cupin domain-containing protein [Pseudomonadota bacterium]